MFINYNARTRSFSENTYRNNGCLCASDMDVMDCINGNSDATMDIETARSLLAAHREQNYSLESDILESLSRVI